MSDSFGLILDVLVVALLGATIFYAATLSRRLSQLRGERGELQSAVRTLAEAAAKAEASIKGLRATADDTGGRLQKQIDRAQALRDELSFLIEAGEALAGRLEHAATRAGDERRRQDGSGADAEAGEPTRTAARGDRRRDGVAAAGGGAAGQAPLKAEALDRGAGEAAAADSADSADSPAGERTVAPRQLRAKAEPKSERRPEMRAEPARRAAAGGKARGGGDRSLIHAIESMR